MDGTAADKCSSCRAPWQGEGPSCSTCRGATGAAHGLDGMGLAIRALLCADCGAAIVGKAGQETECTACGRRQGLPVLTLAPRHIEPGEGGDRGQGLDDALWSQAHSRHGSAYDLSKPPGGQEPLEQLVPNAASTPHQLHAAFAASRRVLEEAAGPKGRGGAYRQAGRPEPRSPDAEHQACWIAHHALELFGQRGEWLRARPLLEQAFELASDETWQHLMLCDLGRLAEAVGDLDAAEQWLAGCDPQPPEIEAHSAYRVRRATVNARRGQWQEALALVGKSQEAMPTSRGLHARMGLLRVAILEQRDGTDQVGGEAANGELAQLVDTHLIADLRELLANDQTLPQCHAAWARLEARWKREAKQKKRAAIQRGLLYCLGGVLAAPVSAGVFFTGTMNLLICQREQVGGAASCRIVETLLGTRVEEAPLAELRGADVNTSGSGDEQSSALILQTAEGSRELSSCSQCAGDLTQRAAKINDYVSKTNTVGQLTVDEASENPAPFIGIFLGLTALALLALGIGRIAKALLRRNDKPWLDD